MTEDEAREYTESLGQIVAGSWRQIAWADRQGIPAALGMTTRQWVENDLGGYVRLSIEDRREAVAELTGEGMSQREAAEILGVGAGTVARDAGAPSGAPPPDPEPLTCDDIPEPAPSGAPPPELSPAERERQRAERAQREIEDGKISSAWTLRKTIATLGNPSAVEWIADYLTEHTPPVDDDERIQALSAFTELLGGDQ